MRTPFKNLLFTLLLASAMGTAGCADSTREPADTNAEMDETEPAASMQPMAMATLSPTQGNTTAGTVTFTQEDDGVHVQANLTGLPEGEHGFHIHETGDCSAPDASSAGGHFNPQGSPHGDPDNDAAERHVGDLGNLEADSDSAAEYDREDDVISLTGANSIIGKAVVVHAGEDDLQSQPSGNAGARLACGVIQQGGAGM